MKNQTYIRCPRCELNYILKKDKFCNVCKQEMKALGTLGAEENLDLELCPLCKINYINPDEDICSACAKERELEEGEAGTRKYGTSEWDTYTSQEDDDSSYEDEEVGDMVSISNLDDSPIGDDDDMDLDLSDEDEESEDESFESEFEDSFDDLDNEDDMDLDLSDEDDLDDYEESEKKKKKK